MVRYPVAVVTIKSVWPGGSKTYTYDAAGRTTQVVAPNGTTNIVYDLESRITSLTGPGITQTSVYNGLDTRVSTTVNNSTRAFGRDGIYVTDPVLTHGADTSFTPGISERRSRTTTFLHSGLKNADAQSSTAQAITATRTYDAFGMIRSSTGTWRGPFGYAGAFGYQEDASGLRLLGHRYYDASTGRFLTRDPIKDGRNWYAYGAGAANPLTMADPTGLLSSLHNPRNAGLVADLVKDGAIITPKPPIRAGASGWLKALLVALGLASAEETLDDPDNNSRKRRPTPLYRARGPEEAEATIRNGGFPVPSPSYEDKKPFWLSPADAMWFQEMNTTKEWGSTEIWMWPNPLGVGFPFPLDQRRAWFVPNVQLPLVGPGGPIRRL